jgi:hypothetical protein
MMLGNLRMDQLAAQCLEPAERAFLVGAHQPRIAGDVGRENGGEAAARAHPLLPAAKRSPDISNSWTSWFGNGWRGTMSTPIARN